MRIISNINIPENSSWNYSIKKCNNICYTNRLVCDKFEHSSFMQTPVMSNISFKSHVSNGSFLKNLSGVRDPYSGVVLLNHKEMNKIYIAIDKTRCANSKIRHLNDYTDSMLPVEKDIFYMFADELKHNKHQTLQEILESKKDVAMDNLIASQKEIFNKINHCIPELSESKATSVKTVLLKAEKQIYLPLEDKDHFKKSRFMNELIRISQVDKFAKIEEKMFTLPEEEQQEAFERLYEVERQFDNYSYNVNINGKTPLDRIYELQKEFIPETLEKPNELDKILDLAMTLPTPKNNTNAFIIEMYNKDDKTIAKRILKDSLGTIEHIVPHYKGGLNEPFNFMFVSKSKNEERSNLPLRLFIRKYPDIPKHTQEYVNDIMHKAQGGRMKGFEWYPYILKETLKQEMGIDIDIKSYSIAPQKVFKSFPEHLKPLYPQFSKYYSEPNYKKYE